MLPGVASGVTPPPPSRTASEPSDANKSTTAGSTAGATAPVSDATVVEGVGASTGGADAADDALSPTPPAPAAEASLSRSLKAVILAWQACRISQRSAEGCSTHCAAGLSSNPSAIMSCKMVFAMGGSGMG